MLPDLPTPSRKRLRPAPLKYVVCQVRHELRPTTDPSASFDVHRQLAAEYPIIEPHMVHDVSVNVGPAGVQASGEPKSGFRLRSQDGAWTVALLPEFFALECTGYTRWSEFRQRFSRVVEAVCTSVGPQLEQRIGLRFIDLLAPDGVESPRDWVPRLDESIAGGLTHPLLSNRIVGLQGVLQLREGAYDVMLRHGVQVEGSEISYVIDTDCARQGGRILDRARMTEDIEGLHTLALQVFQACLAPDYLKSMETDEEATD
jgi:uncharacterized protein (TIGR04255 family)